MTEEKKKKRQNIFCVIIFFVFVLYNLIPSTISLCGKDYENYNIVWAEKLTDFEHSIGGLIPIGKEYYYIVCTKDGYMFLLREDKDWLKGKFDSDGIAVSETGVLIKGKNKNTDTDVSYFAGQVIQDMNRDGELDGVIKSVMYYDYIDGLCDYYDVMSIIAGIVLLAAGVTGFVVYKKHKIPKNKYVIYAALIIFIAILFFECHVIALKGF